MKIDIHALKELRELYFFIMTQLSFRCPYSDLENQDYGSLLNENYSVIDLITNKIAVSNNITELPDWNDLLFDIKDMQSDIITFQNRWNNTYKQWQNDYKKSKLKDVTRGTEYPDTYHLEQQILFGRHSEMNKSVDFLMSNIDYFINKMTRKIENINNLIYAIENKSIFNFRYKRNIKIMYEKIINN